MLGLIPASSDTVESEEAMLNEAHKNQILCKITNMYGTYSYETQEYRTGPNIELLNGFSKTLSNRKAPFCSRAAVFD